MKIAIVAAGFTAAEADELRRSMATFKAKGLVTKFQEKLIGGMTQKGYKLEYAQRVFKQLEGFGSYGFPESHAASFAKLVKFSPYIAGSQFTLADCAAIVHLPVVSSASKIIYGEDLLAALPVKDYLRAMGERPTVQAVNADRKASTELLLASYKAK